MIKQFLSSFLAVLALFHVAGCAAGSPPMTLGDSSGTYVITGRHGDDNMYQPRLYRLPPSCAGRSVELRAVYRTESITDGTKNYHGIHFDYEVFVAGGSPTYPSDWRAEPSHEWQVIERSWDVPADMRSGYVRIGLQGVSGRLYVHSIRVTGC